MTNKKITLENLAIMVKKGFDQTATKEDLLYLATKEDLRGTEERLNHKIDGLELKISANSSGWSHDFERLHEWVEDLSERLETLEKRAKIKNEIPRSKLRGIR